MKAERVLWVGMLGAAIAMPAIAANGRIHFTGRIVVPADCRAEVQARGRLPAATLDCGAQGGAARRPAEPVAEVVVRPLPVRSARPGAARAYVVDVTYR